jgi:hypothetical protein
MAFLIEKKIVTKTKLHYTIIKEYGTNQTIITDRFGQGTFTYNQNLEFDGNYKRSKKKY